MVNSSFQDLDLVNNSGSFKNVLKPKEYNTSIKVDKNEITAKADFHKSLPFIFKLTSYSNRMTFNRTKVQSFGGYGGRSTCGKTVTILYYKNDNNFAIKLDTKSTEDEIILLKDKVSFSTMNEVVKEVYTKIEVGEKEKKSKNKSWKYDFEKNDFVLIPKINFNLEHNFSTIEGNRFLVNKEEFEITTFWQRNAFILDEAGAIIESEAKIGMKSTEDQLLRQPKRMIFDEPFFVMFKKKNSENPYFCLWIANEELMIKE